MKSESEVDVALRRYAQAYSDVIRQKRIIAELEMDEHPTLGARTLLRLLEADLALHHQSIERLQASQLTSSASA